MDLVKLLAILPVLLILACTSVLAQEPTVVMLTKESSFNWCDTGECGSGRTANTFSRIESGLADGDFSAYEGYLSWTFAQGLSGSTLLNGELALTAVILDGNIIVHSSVGDLYLTVIGGSLTVNEIGEIVLDAKLSILGGTGHFFTITGEGTLSLGILTLSFGV